jgi:cytoskeletal protein RodZ
LRLKVGTLRKSNPSSGMDRQKLTKSMTLIAVSLASVAFLGSSVVGMWQLAQAPAPIRMPSQNAQAETQANSALEILRSKPQDADANKSFELVLSYYASQNNIPKLIQVLEKHQQVAPNSPNASRYQEVLAQLKVPASASPSPKAADKKKTTSTPAASPVKPSDK